jgi:hypothetical protein
MRSFKEDLGVEGKLRCCKAEKRILFTPYIWSPQPACIMNVSTNNVRYFLINTRIFQLLKQ